ncbi:MAG: cytidylate kinase-like family protein [Candidatus Beckwithbacteria bacterium]|nr:cytidylate kinase-like family protein [Candidatus Beckwithbacteria bacterium]
MGLFDNLIGQYVKRREFVSKEIEGVDETSRKVKIRPFITISRESGSGGKPIAQLVAKKLKYKFYNKKLIDLTAKETKKRQALIASLDEKDRGMVEDLVYSLLSPDYVDEETYFKHLCHVILTVARKGNCVILGRGANFITGGYGGLHVRIEAPFLVRSGYTAQYEKLSIYEARERMQRLDKERKKFIQEHFGKDPSNPNYYDLVINTTYLNIAQAAEIILTAFKNKFPDWKNYR